MTDRSEPLTPEEEAAVARMLADAAGPEPMPADVSDRLQGLIDELAEERAADDTGGEVVELRRRRWPQLMLAAAAVLVVGYGVGSVVGDGSLSGSDADSATAGAADSMQSDSRDAESAPSEGQLRRNLENGPRPGLLAGQVRPVRLHSARLDVGVRRALDVLAAQAVADRAEVEDPEAGSAGDGASEYSAGRRCRPPTLAKDEDSLPVRYDGRPAVLVTRPADDGLVEVTVFSCGGTELDGTTLER